MAAQAGGGVSRSPMRFAFIACQSDYDGGAVPGGVAAGGVAMIESMLKCLRWLRFHLWGSGLLAVAAAGLVGCASTVPAPIRTAPPGAPTVTEVRGDIDRFVGQPVRWGGTVASVDNRAKETWVEIVARDLGSDGRPVDDDRSEGRFLARVGAFLDPAVYTAGRQVTVAGVVDGSATRPIGDFPYVYPVVRAQTVYLWEPLPERVPYYYDPWWFYDPWYPHPWHHHRYR
jgi:outer membrane lipoprotein